VVAGSGALSELDLGALLVIFEFAPIRALNACCEGLGLVPVLGGETDLEGRRYPSAMAAAAVNWGPSSFRLFPGLPESSKSLAELTLSFVWNCTGLEGLMKVGDPGVEPSWDICGSILDSAINRYLLQAINLALCGHVVRYEVVKSS